MFLFTTCFGNWRLNRARSDKEILGSVTSYCEFCALAPDQLRHRRRRDRLVSGAQPGIEKGEDRELFGLKDAALPS